MRITRQHLDETLIFRFSGHAKLHEWEEATQELLDFYEKGGKSIIINWQDVDMIDTSSLQVLVRLLKIQREDSDFEFFLVTKDPNHIKILKVFGFNKLMQVVSSENRALELRKYI